MWLGARELAFGARSRQSFVKVLQRRVFARHIAGDDERRQDGAITDIDVGGVEDQSRRRALNARP